METHTEEMKQRLELMLAEITIELESLGIHNPDVVEDWIATPPAGVASEADPNVAADITEEWEGKRATLSVLETRFNNIRRALVKISEGNYGTCEVSGEKIETERLDANPAARTCEAHMNDESNLSQ